MQPISRLGIILLSTGFVYSMIVSCLAYRQTGKRWMLYLPQWIDASSGAKGKIISAYLRDPDGNLLEVSNYICSGTGTQCLKPG